MNGEGVRIDVWLWRARFFKTRALAAVAAGEGLIRVARNGDSRRVEKAAALVRPGDWLTLAAGGRVRTIEVLAGGTRRGPAAEARTLYREIAAES